MLWLQWLVSNISINVSYPTQSLNTPSGSILWVLKMFISVCRCSWHWPVWLQAATTQCRELALAHWKTLKSWTPSSSFGAKEYTLNHGSQFQRVCLKNLCLYSAHSHRTSKLRQKQYVVLQVSTTLNIIISVKQIFHSNSFFNATLYHGQVCHLSVDFFPSVFLIAVCWHDIWTFWLNKYFYFRNTDGSGCHLRTDII